MIQCRCPWTLAASAHLTVANDKADPLNLNTAVAGQLKAFPVLGVVLTRIIHDGS